MTKHTPTPWRYDEESGYIFGPDGFNHIDQPNCYALSEKYLKGDHKEHWGSMPDGKREISEEENIANAAFIVRAVNSHDALAEALEKIKNHSARYFNFGAVGGLEGKILKEVEAALALAKGE